MISSCRVMFRTVHLAAGIQPSMNASLRYDDLESSSFHSKGVTGPRHGEM